jgi:hypothetical protein
MKIRLKHGSILYPENWKDAPLIFIVGGLTMPIINGNVPPNFYPGDKKENILGYMWNWKNNGFDRLNNYILYNCFTHENTNNAFDEFIVWLSDKNINKKINVVCFSAGCTSVFKKNGIIDKYNNITWDKILIAGGYFSSSKNSSYVVNNICKLSKTNKNNMFYFTLGSPNKASEGATKFNKEKIINCLPKQNIFYTSGNHGDHVKWTSTFFLNTPSNNKINTIINKILKEFR